MKLIKKTIFSTIVCLLALPLLVLAANNTSTNAGGNNSSSNTGVGNILIENPLKGGVNNLYDFLSLIVNDIILPIGGVIAVLFIIYAGFMLVTARGDETKLKNAKRAFTYAAIGTLILLGSWAIAEALKGTITQITNG